VYLPRYASIVLTAHAFLVSKKDDLDTAVPPLSAIAFCAGFMLSTQCDVAYHQYEKAIGSLMNLESSCLELMRHSVMLLDDGATHELKYELRRVMLATLTCLFVDIRTAAANDTLTYGLGRECLRRAHKVGMFSDAEYDMAVGLGSKLAPYALTAEVQRKVLQLLYAEPYAAWRAAMRTEKTLQVPPTPPSIPPIPQLNTCHLNAGACMPMASRLFFLPAFASHSLG
jgi:predicted membrane chloride channel (bestrophin family)